MLSKGSECKHIIFASAEEKKCRSFGLARLTRFVTDIRDSKTCLRKFRLFLCQRQKLLLLLAQKTAPLTFLEIRTGPYLCRVQLSLALSRSDRLVPLKNLVRPNSISGRETNTTENPFVERDHFIGVKWKVLFSFFFNHLIDAEKTALTSFPVPLLTFTARQTNSSLHISQKSPNCVVKREKKRLALKFVYFYCWR